MTLPEDIKLFIGELTIHAECRGAAMHKMYPDKAPLGAITVDELTPEHWIKELDGYTKRLEKMLTAAKEEGYQEGVKAMQEAKETIVEWRDYAGDPDAKVAYDNVLSLFADQLLNQKENPQEERKEAKSFQRQELDKYLALPKEQQHRIFDELYGPKKEPND